MERLRPVKLYGNTYVITLARADVKDLKIEEGDEADISKLIIVKKSGNKNDK